jgi:hypothetical protein
LDGSLLPRSQKASSCARSGGRWWSYVRPRISSPEEASVDDYLHLFVGLSFIPRNGHPSTNDFSAPSRVFHVAGSFSFPQHVCDTARLEPRVIRRRCGNAVKQPRPTTCYIRVSWPLGSSRSRSRRPRRAASQTVSAASASTSRHCREGEAAMMEPMEACEREPIEAWCKSLPEREAAGPDDSRAGAATYRRRPEASTNRRAANAPANRRAAETSTHRSAPPPPTAAPPRPPPTAPPRTPPPPPRIWASAVVDAATAPAKVTAANTIMILRAHWFSSVCRVNSECRSSSLPSSGSLQRWGGTAWPRRAVRQFCQPSARGRNSPQMEFMLSGDCSRK